MSSLFFGEASWTHHDRGYARGAPVRATCDRLFLRAMLRDAADLPTAPRMAAGGLLAWLFWALCRLFGWTAYNRARR